MNWRNSVIALLLCGASVTRAGTSLPIAMESDAQATIKVGSCFENLPPCGYAPIDVNISNAADRERAWTFNFTSPGFHPGGSANSMSFRAKLSVPANAARTFKLIVPMTSRSTNLYRSPLDVSVSGPGSNPGVSYPFPIGKNNGSPPTAAVAMSETLATKSWSQLEKEIAGHSSQLTGSQFDAAELPDDWRALIGFSGLWMTENDLAELSAGQREALRDWISRGGTLFFYGRADAANGLRPSAFGRIMALAGRELDVEETASAIFSMGPSLEMQLADGDGGISAARALVGEIKANVPLLITFMGLFAIAVGPVNLFLLASHGRRHRLFWTTPVISIAASVLLVVLIFLQDGIGGSGVRMALVQILPAQKKAVLLQKQVSRTGVLASSSFSIRDPVFIAPIALDSRPNAQKGRYENIGTSFGGDWFTSRTVQAHWIESITPTRADVSLVNAAAVRDSEAEPIVVSGIGAPLDEIYYLDENGHPWRGENVRTGEKATLHTAPVMADLLPLDAGARLNGMWKRVSHQRGYFYATARADAFVNTLPSIRWKTPRVVYLGPITMPP